MVLSSVDLPAPLAPISVTTSPARDGQRHVAQHRDVPVARRRHPRPQGAARSASQSSSPPPRRGRPRSRPGPSGRAAADLPRSCGRRSSTTISSETSITSPMSCSTTTSVVPASRIRYSTSASSRVSTAFRPAAGSSSSSRRGRVASARAISSSRAQSVRQVGGRRVGRLVEAHEAQQAVRVLAREPLLAERARADAAPRETIPVRVTGNVPDQHVVERGQLLEELRVLERPRHPGTHERVRPRDGSSPAVEADAPRGRPVEPGHAVEQRRLPRPVRTDDRLDRAVVHVERHRVERREAAESAREAVDRQQAHEALPSPVPPRAADTSPQAAHDPRDAARSEEHHGDDDDAVDVALPVLQDRRPRPSTARAGSSRRTGSA